METKNIGTHRTTVTAIDGNVIVTYHQTPVVIWDTKHSIVKLNSGGYMSKTTKLRMNQASEAFNLGFRVYQRDFTWYVDINGHVMSFNGDKAEFQLLDGQAVNLTSVN